ncbi:MAG: type VI secretion system-associated FHA domain protein TagH [Ramlibacter sp.]|nr:type VI secretion system-associated FHA domain protein TagH [Ramlibacter sp.]
MPQVTLDLVSLDDKPVAGASCRFEGAGGTIGRDEGNTLALPDPHRRVSRLHATISFPHDVPTITNSSTVLTIDAGGAQLKSGQAMPLAQGMRLGIGPYVLLVSSCEAPAGAEPQEVLEPTQNLAAVAPAGADPFAGLSAPDAPAPGPSAVPMPGAPLHPVDDPLAGLLGSAASTPRAPAAGADPLAAFGGAPAAGADPFAALGQLPRAALDPLAAPAPSADLGGAPARTPPPALLIPEDFNPFDLPSASARNSADPLAAMSGGSGAGAPHALVQAEESIDALFAPGGAASGDPFLAAVGAGAGVPGSASGAASSLLAQPDNGDPLALFGDAARPESLGVPMRDDLAEIGGAYQPPRPLQPQPASPPAPQAAPRGAAPAQAFQPPPMPVGSADALARAFLTGARLPPAALPHGLTPEVMALIGALLRSATAGAIDMLAVRANIKREVQASVTIISTEANNPLKFLPNAEAVLLQFLGRAMPGFMRPDEAMDDAFNDLRAHELGVIAGTRAALDEVLAKFDPAILGERLIRGSLLEKALPAMRKTRLWDLYLERYAQLRREVEDDFQSVFGKAFVAAYESETARMKARSTDRGP